MTTIAETPDILQSAMRRRQLAQALKGPEIVTPAQAREDAIAMTPKKGVGSFGYLSSPGLLSLGGTKEGKEDDGIMRYSIETMDHPIKRYLSKCFFFFGPRGRAKSLSITYWLYTLRSLYDKIYGPEPRHCPICSRVYHEDIKHRPIRIATNYKCDVADIQDPYLVDKLMNYPPWAHDMDVAIDELGAYVPAARAMSSTALNIGTWLQQIRKRRINIYMATQYAQDITRNVLRQVDLFLEPETFDDGQNVFLYPYDLWGYYTGDMEYKRWPPRRQDAFAAPILQRNTAKVFGLYDTEEIFAPIWYNQRDTMVDEAGYTFGNDGDPNDLLGGDVSIKSISELLLMEAKRKGYIEVGVAYGQVKHHPEAEAYAWKRTVDFEDYLRAEGWVVDTSKQGYAKHTAVPPLL